jgi:uncharacterized protein
VIAPQAVVKGTLSFKKARTLAYEGLKEDVYVPEFRPDRTIFNQLGLDTKSILVTVRPPATEAHYHNPDGEALLVTLMERLGELSEVQTVLLPRNKRQEADMRRRWPAWFEGRRVVVPGCAIDGLNLLWHSDLVVSGGGTMNREAAALGVPVYSIFRGHIGAIDRQLSDDGRLVLIQNVEEIRQKIAIKRRPKGDALDGKARPALGQITDHVERILRERHATKAC